MRNGDSENENSGELFGHVSSHASCWGRTVLLSSVQLNSEPHWWLPNSLGEQNAEQHRENQSIGLRFSDRVGVLGSVLLNTVSPARCLTLLASQREVSPATRVAPVGTTGVRSTRNSELMSSRCGGEFLNWMRRAGFLCCAPGLFQGGPPTRRFGGQPATDVSR